MQNTDFLTITQEKQKPQKDILFAAFVQNAEYWQVLFMRSGDF